MKFLRVIKIVVVIVLVPSLALLTTPGQSLQLPTHGTNASRLTPAERDAIMRGARDHTRVMKALFENMDQIIGILKKQGYRRGSGKPTAEQVLRAMLQAPRIDSYTKGRIREVLRVLPTLRRAQRDVPPQLRTASKEIIGRLAPLRTVSEKIRYLQSTKSNRRYSQHRSLLIGIEGAIAILRDGESTMSQDGYLATICQAVLALGNPSDEFKKMCKDVEDDDDEEDEVADADISGAIEGGIAGGVSGAAVGAAGGALAGAILGFVVDGIGSSIGEAIAQML